MTTPLLPVSSSPSPSSFPIVSRWGTYTVILLSGLSVLGLFLYAIYRRCKPQSRSDRKPLPPPLPPNEHLFRPFNEEQENILAPRIDRKYCRYETPQLPFKLYTEGVISISVSTILEGKTMAGLDHFTVLCLYKNQEFFVLREPLPSDSVIKFSMPNMPYEQTMLLNFNRTVTLKFSLEKQNQTVFSNKFDIEASEEKGFYRISQWGCKPRPLLSK